MTQRRSSDAFKNTVLALCALALVANLAFMWRLDAKQDRYIEYGKYQSELEAAQDSINRLLQDQQTILAYEANLRSYWRQILVLEENEEIRQVIESMLNTKLALIAPQGDQP
jgi:hypothetical protein